MAGAAPGGDGRGVDGAERRRDVAGELEVGLAVSVELVGLDVEVDDLRLLAEAAAEAEAEVERDADDEGDVGLLEAPPPRPAEAELVVGGDAAAAHAVEEDGDLERGGEAAERLLAVGPVEAGAGHDRRALGLRQELAGLLGALGGLAVGALGRRRHLGLGLGEDDVERVVDEDRAARLLERAVERGAVTAAISAGSFTVSALLVTGATNGTWSISWSEPEPQRISGARPPSTTSGERF